jgi:acyl-CoA synthetase (NDP forming)
VALDLGDLDAVRAAAEDIAARLGSPALVVERQALTNEGLELIIGCRRDVRFGPIVLIGLGGVFTEVLSDVRTALAPVGAEQAAALLHELRGAPLLAGARGRAPLDVAAAAEAAAALSRFAAFHPEIAEVEVNPLLVLPRGVQALDARIIVHPHGDETDHP